MKKILDSIVRFVLSLNETKRNETNNNMLKKSKLEGGAVI